MNLGSHSHQPYAKAGRFFALVTLFILGFAVELAFAQTGAIQMLDKAHAVSNRLAKLTNVDVPAKWKGSAKTNITQDTTRIEHFRGTNMVLEVRWNKEWTGVHSNRFTARIFDGTNRLARIFWIPDRGTVTMGLMESGGDYEVQTTVKTNGRISVTVSGKSGFMEWVEVDGRNTHLADDLEFTKSATIFAEVMKPFMEAVDKSIGIDKPK